MEKNNAYPIWPGWETVRLIGRGSFGAVYEIRRTLFGDVERAALKVITIPQHESDIDEMYSDGYDNESITATFQSHLQSILNEYSLMRKLNGNSNVVSCDDVRYVKHTDGIGWDILIKMELLTPLTRALPERVPEAQVIAIGRDICRALVLCRKFNIVHRDIKPQNIFVSDLGEYKLGDFGIAKTVEKTSGGTKIGTYKYMAPEVYRDQPYGAAADIYSLGLVLYWLLNERRTPFLPLPPEKLRAGVEEEARLRRFKGETIPAPAHGSDALKDIVLKACAYRTEDRYQSAADMLADLEALKSGVVDLPDTPGESAASAAVSSSPEEGTSVVRELEPEIPEDTAVIAEPDAPEDTAVIAEPDAPEDTAVIAEPDAPEDTAVIAEPDAPEDTAIPVDPEAESIKRKPSEERLPGTPDPALTEIAAAASPEVISEDDSVPEAETMVENTGSSVPTVPSAQEKNASPPKNRKKKAGLLIGAAALVVLVLGLLLFRTLGAANEIFPGDRSDDAAYTYLSDSTMYSFRDGVLTIAGTGDMPDFKITKNTPWFEFRDEIRSVIIEDGITSVSRNAFYGFSQLESVSFPGSCRDLGEYCFAYCNSLRSVDLPEGLERIGVSAFMNCASLETATIPSSVSTIETNAFYTCPNLRDVYYNGDAEQWEMIHIGSRNPFEGSNATIYNLRTGQQLTTGILAGGWDSRTIMLRGTTNTYPFLLDEPVRNCTKMTLNLSLSSSQNVLNGMWALFVRKSDGLWYQVSEFKVDSSFIDQYRPIPVELGSPTTFDALAIAAQFNSGGNYSYDFYVTDAVTQ